MWLFMHELASAAACGLATTQGEVVLVDATLSKLCSVTPATKRRSRVYTVTFRPWRRSRPLIHRYARMAIAPPSEWPVSTMRSTVGSASAASSCAVVARPHDAEA